MLYKHSVRIDRRKCVGCTNCIKSCPTEAIRVQRGKAKILDERCIDCGTCLVSCPHHAMISVTTPLGELNEFQYNIVIPTAALYSQFRGLQDLGDIYSVLYSMGFDAIYDEAKGYEIMAEATRKYLRSGEAVTPLITCSCPVIPRLVTTLYPSLIDNLSPFISATEISARVAKEEFCEVMGVPKSSVGCFYIAPCAAKMTNMKSPLGIEKSEIDGVYSLVDIYARILKDIGKVEGGHRNIAHPACAYGLGSAVVGGVSTAVGLTNYLAVDGIQNVMQCLEEIDNERLLKLSYLEVAACSGGCVGGPLTFENQFVAKNRNRRIAHSQPRLNMETDEHIQKYVNSPMIRYDYEFTPRSVMKLSDDMAEALRMMDRMEDISKRLPGLDCGSCGSPSCKTLAEDIVRGQAVEMDCIFKLRDRLRILAQEMADLASAEKRG